MIEEISWEATLEETKCLVVDVGKGEEEEEVVHSSKRPKVGDHLKPTLSRLPKGRKDPFRSLLQGVVILGDAPSESKRREKGKEKFFVDLASSGGEQEASHREKHSRRMFVELIRKVGQRLLNESIQDLDFQDVLGAQAFNNAASTSMKSMNALKEYKKKMARETAKVAEFRTAMDSMIATVDNAKAAYERMSLDLAEAEGNIVALTKKLDDALNA
ncbi:hypothetical protein Adt_05632 [Abeliophyllum distichum]|uniref:Uncharacterized protein n=1 Tax=Abeliophyllum distichum TaxID=126358 RepID=A0ABD1V519_9LAMI